MHFLKQNFSTTKTPLFIFFMVVFSIVYDIDFWKNKFGLDTARHAVRRFQGTDKSLKNDIQNNNTNTVKPNMHQRLTVPLLFVGTVATKYSCCFILCLVNLIRGEVFLYCLMQKHLLFSLFFFAVWQGSLSHETLTWENKLTHYLKKDFCDTITIINKRSVMLISLWINPVVCLILLIDVDVVLWLGLILLSPPSLA